MIGNIIIPPNIIFMDQQQPTIDDLILALPLVEKVPVVALKSLLDERQALDNEQEQRISEIKAKYQRLMKPYLERASELIQGKDPKQQQVAAINNYLKPNQKIGNPKGKVIENYWNSVLQNSLINNQISEKDQKALEYLLDVQLLESQPTENLNNVNLKFIFKANPYFTETVITRKLRFVDGACFSLEGDKVTWKQGNWLTHESKKISNKSTGETKVTQGKKIDSFFDIFLDWNDTDNHQELSRVSNIVFELVGIIKDSLSYFLGLFEFDGQSQQEGDYIEEDDQEEEESNPKSKKK